MEGLENFALFETREMKNWAATDLGRELSSNATVISS
jgi:hypothetical protein